MIRPGFSLIEILIAMAISSFVMTMVFSTISMLQKSSSRYNELITVDSQQEILFSQLQKDIAGIVLPAYGFKASPKDKPEDAQKKQQEYYEKFTFQFEMVEDRLKMLTFVTTSILATYGAEKPHLVRVRYTLVPDERNNKYFTLMRQESTELLLQDFEKNSPPNYAIGYGFKTCAIACTLISTDKDNKKKVEEVSSWDFAERIKKQDKDAKSTEKIEQKIALPQIITFKGTMSDFISDYEYDFNYAFFVPIDPKLTQKTEPKQEQKAEEPAADNQAGAQQKSGPEFNVLGKKLPWGAKQ